MDLINVIKTRRTIRKFTERQISDSNVNKLIEAAINAPSSRDCQPWHIIIVKELGIKKALADIGHEENYNCIISAPVVLVICVDKNKSPSRFIEDGVCATQNMLLAAHALGLSSVYIPGNSTENKEIAIRVQNVLKLPKHIFPITILPTGYPAEKPEKKDLINVGDITHQEAW